MKKCDDILQFHISEIFWGHKVEWESVTEYEPVIFAFVEVVLLVRTMIRKERRVLVVALDVIGELVHAEAPVRYRDLERLHLL